ncbi:MAG TPA: nucleoside triphosphate pyrophosphohydrolase [Rhodanobacteraceae bacterium]
MTDTHASLDRLLAIMRRLRDPDGGCPWDSVQTFESVAPYTLEEAHEVVDAIDRGDYDDLRDELGDLLFQVVFHACMAQEQNLFDFADVATAIGDKLVRRHPHVFADAHYADADAQTRAWEDIKAAERRGRGEADASALTGVARGLSPERRAAKLQSRAARTGFQWSSLPPVVAKLDEEMAELKAECAASTPDAARIEDELGDVLFMLVNLARHTQTDFARALRHANAKFERRFRGMEQLAAADGTRMDDLSLAEQEALWQRVKHAERQDD